MPTAPRTHRARPKAARVDRRLGSRQRGYDGDWERVAAYVRERDCYLCQECKRKGHLRPGKEVDHILPLHVRPDLRLEETNCQTICRPCHTAKTHRDNATYGSASARTLTTSQWQARHRANALSGRKTAKRVVVWGLPASGKTTWVKEHAEPGALAWDSDEVAQREHGVTAYPWPSDVVTHVLGLRALWLKEAESSDKPAYVIVTDERAAKAIAGQLGAEIVHCEVDEAVRQERIAARAATLTSVATMAQNCGAQSHGADTHERKVGVVGNSV